MASPSSQDIYDETLAVFARSERRYEPLTTPEVADALDANRRTVYKRLQKLVDRGQLRTKKTGSHSRVWWRPPADSSAGTSSSGETDGESNATPGSSGERLIRAADEESSGPAEREQAHVDYDEIFQALPDGVIVQDPTDGTLIDVNRRCCEMLGYPRGELLTTGFEAIHGGDPPYTRERAKQYVQEAATEGSQTFDWRFETNDGEQLPVDVHLQRTTIDGEDRILAVLRDKTEREDRTRELRETNRQLQAALDTVEAAIFIKDTDGQYQLLNEECRDLFQLGPDVDVVGLTDEDLFPEDVAEQYRSDDQRVLERGETIEIEEEVPTAEGTRINLTLKSPLYDPNGEPAGVCAVSTDITERKEYERKLQARSAAMEASIDGMAILDENEEYVFVNQAHADTYGYDDPDAFLGETWRMCYDEDERARIENEILPTLSEEGAWRGEVTGQRKDGTSFPQEVSLSVTENGGTVCVVRDTTARKERERALEQQRDRLEALDHLNDVVRETTDAIIAQSTQEEIEQVVCDQLAESDSYCCAWVGEVDSNRAFHPRVEAGVDGSLDEVSSLTDLNDPAEQGPIEKAVRTQEVQRTQQGLSDPGCEQWYEQMDKCRCQSSVVIPLVYRDTLYGVLGVSSERPDAFAENEREVISQLGEVIGHAIAAVDRKRALMSDEVVELTLRLLNMRESQEMSVSTDGKITIERTIPLDDDRYLVYGTATEDPTEVLRAMGERYDHWTSFDTFETADGRVQFEQYLSDPPMASIIAAHGGYFEDGQIENGVYSSTIHLPPGTDIRRLLTKVRETYQNAEIISQQQVTREEPSQWQLLSPFGEKLTERQRAALEAGYYGGFFEWPRDRSGEDIAESLGVGASTFHQHVRKAEKKLLDVVFADA